MIIILGRNEPNGKYTTAVEEENGKVYLRCYEQKDGMSTFENIITQIELDDYKVISIAEYYNRLKPTK